MLETQSRPRCQLILKVTQFYRGPERRRPEKITSGVSDRVDAGARRSFALMRYFSLGVAGGEGDGPDDICGGFGVFGVGGRGGMLDSDQEAVSVKWWICDSSNVNS